MDKRTVMIDMTQEERQTYRNTGNLENEMTDKQSKRQTYTLKDRDKQEYRRKMDRQMDLDTLKDRLIER
jgi:hypothetical protein